MSSSPIRFLLCAAVVLAASTPARAQQRIDRFPEPAPPAAAVVPAALTAIEGRSSYWLEGVAIGVAAGIVAGVLTIDRSTACPTGVGHPCPEDYAPLIIGSTLLGIGGGFLGGMIGASISRDRSDGGEP